MGYYKPQQIAMQTISNGTTKASLPFMSMLLLGFLGGAFISIGYLLDIRVTASLPPAWGTFGSFLGAAVFPLGLILIILAGGELLTGNMMAVALACFAGKVSPGRLIYNWIMITVSNFIGAIFVAYVFGHLAGLTSEDPFLAKTVAFAKAKIDQGFWPAFYSAIGCNWLVGLAVWLSYGCEEMSSKILSIWFPIMGFVAIGFQHVVANMFVIPAAIFSGHFTWNDYFSNFVPVFLGNAVGGSIFVSLFYWLSYKAVIKD
ncbi:formate/nitrite transporter family protein [Heyndrickxia ginsengihumi]|uniref:Formate/nitrite transporter n=1 Tax=Heyndrickxia ginsengihumi TaxID=363870 RepID=A0A0A6Y0N0_9BACI|nr:formate/nitrite transporter family protein [Heyndrickxia ginsengihumi]KHD85842.1 formate/nitrite transporter [Heyndrickxia ginsengihumi]MBE6185563.1 formate/nitrite transporter family protein [Bacillus sp. (in: firmicutes)]MCM3023986.1 formate/nitrite transporter family protein [Heyndrickxia ginsengihumi]NEY21248.1 formate/nitrite transporter family protein [Heyndrickxia ginsengihumi]